MVAGVKEAGRGAGAPLRRTLAGKGRMRRRRAAAQNLAGKRRIRRRRAATQNLAWRGQLPLITND